MTGSFITRLRTGIPGSEMGPWFPRETIPVYVITLTGSLAVILAFTLTSFTLATSVPIQLAAVAMLLIVSGALARRYKLGGFDALLEGIGLLGLMSLLCQLGSILLSASQMPLADPWLARADAAVGFDWFAMVRFLQTHDTILAAAEYLYHALTWQPGLVVLLLIMTGQRQSVLDLPDRLGCRPRCNIGYLADVTGREHLPLLRRPSISLAAHG